MRHAAEFALGALTVVVVWALLNLAAAIAGSDNSRRVIAGLACIHTHEGAWNADTGNGYYGGLQMNTSFERAYGREFLRAFGHANHWPPALQLAVGVRGYLARGWNPWPVTARLCGLH
jgi:hypothetical protein